MPSSCLSGAEQRLNTIKITVTSLKYISRETCRSAVETVFRSGQKWSCCLVFSRIRSFHHVPVKIFCCDRQHHHHHHHHGSDCLCYVDLEMSGDQWVDSSVPVGCWCEGTLCSVGVLSVSRTVQRHMRRVCIIFDMMQQSVLHCVSSLQLKHTTC